MIMNTNILQAKFIWALVSTHQNHAATSSNPRHIDLQQITLVHWPFQIKMYRFSALLS